MHVIGLAGPAGSGKDTVADYLCRNHGYLKFSFSDALYREVMQAFAVKMGQLCDRETKEKPTPRLSLAACSDPEFTGVASAKLALEADTEDAVDEIPLSPRWVLQTWGTEYRRQQKPDYWLDRAGDWFVQKMRDLMPEFYRLKVVNTSVRYANEADWIRRLGGEVWHMRRLQCPLLLGATGVHSSEAPVVVEPQDTVIHNNGTIDRLWTALRLRLNDRNLKEVRVDADEPLRVGEISL